MVFSTLKEMEWFADGGAFVIDVVGKERVARLWKDAICDELDDGTLVLQRPAILDDWTRLRSEWRLIREDGNRTFALEHWIYSGGELKSLLQRAGFAGVRLFGDLDGSSYGLDASRLIAVARKPDA